MTTTTATVRLTHDIRYTYHGLGTPGGVCRIRVFDRGDRPAIIIATELPENSNTSITNLTEVLAAEVTRRYLRPGQPFIWVEHYPARSHSTRYPTLDVVTFADTERRVRRLGPANRVSFGTPSWKRLTEQELSEMLDAWPRDDLLEA